MQAIGYLRVSTREQGRSGLGLAALHREIEKFGKRQGFTVRTWHQEIQTGARAAISTAFIVAAVVGLRKLAGPW
jgi:DNA invertase Pin-like site-specific DNA recombinase